MPEKKDDRETKHPIEMTTDEALDYCLGPEIAERLKREVEDDDPEDSESD
jgi:hypothetical protein